MLLEEISGGLLQSHQQQVDDRVRMHHRGYGNSIYTIHTSIHYSYKMKRFRL